MTAAQIGWFVIAAFALWQAHAWLKKQYECPYCGRYKSHDDHCPYLM